MIAKYECIWDEQRKKNRYKSHKAGFEIISWGFIEVHNEILQEYINYSGLLNKSFS